MHSTRSHVGQAPAPQHTLPPTMPRISRVCRGGRQIAKTLLDTSNSVPIDRNPIVGRQMSDVVPVFPLRSLHRRPRANWHRVCDPLRSLRLRMHGHCRSRTLHGHDALFYTFIFHDSLQAYLLPFFPFGCCDTVLRANTFLETVFPAAQLLCGLLCVTTFTEDFPL